MTPGTANSRPIPLPCPSHKRLSRLDGCLPGCSASRPRQQLVDQDLLEPLLVLLAGPSSVTDEQPVDLGRHERVDDVRGLALVQVRAQGPGIGQVTGDPRLVLLPVPCPLGEQRGAEYQDYRRA